MMTIVATKQQQARRYAELYGMAHMDPYARRALYGHLGPGMIGTTHRYGGARHNPFAEEMFWEDFESGRRGGGSYLQMQQQRSSADAFFRLQILQMLLAERGRAAEDDDDEDDEDEEEEEEAELLTAHAAFYEEERRQNHSHRY